VKDLVPTVFLALTDLRRHRLDRIEPQEFLSVNQRNFW